MQLNEIFRNFVNEPHDNATCDSCGEQFTVTEVHRKHATEIECPNCHAINNVEEAISRYEEDKHIVSNAPDLDPFADSEMTGSRMGSTIRR